MKFDWHESEDRVIVRTHNYKSGSVYHGDWKGREREGKGKMTWADGSSY